jgi:dTDP-4-amino-4,6-dideoxygalactose transaminase
MPELAINGGKPVRTKKFPRYAVIGEAEKKAAMRVLDSGILSKYLGCWEPDFYGGTEVQALEKEWANYFGVKHAIAVNSCTSGLQAAVGALGIGPGDEVIVSPYTMAASASAPLVYGAIPVFADIEPDYFCLDPKSVEAKITPRTKAIIVVDLFGQPYNREALNALAKKHNLKIIEDCAQGPGSKLDGKFAGTLGDIGVYSLNYHKHIHTGEGGMIVTDNDELAERLQLIRNHAEAVVGDKGTQNLVNMVGYNFRLTEIQAAIARELLKKLEKLVDDRIKNCDYLATELGKIPGLTFPGARNGAKHVYYMQPFLIDEATLGASRNAFINAVKAELPETEGREGEGALISYGYNGPLHLLPLFQQKIAIGSNGFPWKNGDFESSVSYAKGTLPVTERLYEKELATHDFMLPPITKEEMDDVIMAFKKVYEHRSELKN